MRLMQLALVLSQPPQPDRLLLPLCLHRQHEEERGTHTQDTRLEGQRRGWGEELKKGGKEEGALGEKTRG